MTEGKLGSTIVAQIAIMVHDIEKTAATYAGIFGVDIPKIIITDTVDKARTNYRGQSTSAQAKLAFFDMGQVQLELIEPIGGPSIWQEHLDAKGESVHHIAFWIKDTDGVKTFLAQHNIEAVQQGYFTGGMYTYFDSAPQLGVMLELLEKFEQ
jgi:catechol 2,3-dioxygenase-like lactoylglutathione lyase family enzyme